MRLTDSCLASPFVVMRGTVGEATLLQSDQTEAEATESARSDVVSRLCSSRDLRTRVSVSERHKLAERMSDRRRVQLCTRLRNNNIIKLSVLTGDLLRVHI